MVRRTVTKSLREFPIEPANRNLELDFDQWAAEVRQQMLAALRRRGNDSEDMD